MGGELESVYSKEFYIHAESFGEFEPFCFKAFRYRICANATLPFTFSAIACKIASRSSI